MELTHLDLWIAGAVALGLVAVIVYECGRKD